MPYKDKERQNEYQRERIARRREDYFSDKHCIVCGTTDNLELDHIDPAKKVSHSIWSWSEEHRAIELAKCQVLCHDCHVKKTKRDMGYGLIHGTPAGYRYYAVSYTHLTLP